VSAAPAAGPAAPPPGAAGLDSLHSARGRLHALLADAGVAAGAVDGAGAPLEAQSLGTPEPARLVAAAPIEGHALRARRVADAPVDGAPDPDAPLAFTAFLDGTQSSHVLRYHDGLPVVWGTVAAVVRARRNRTMGTWGRGPRVERRVYAPCGYLPAAVCAALQGLGMPVRDTTEPGPDGALPPSHPLALLDRAVHFVQADRERAERELAEEWCRRQSTDGGFLLVDGGIQGSDLLAGARCVLGVVKSHRTLYAEGDALRLVLALGAGERSTAFRVSVGRRAPVASWYLRLRDPAGRDPMWGLVRVEAALPDAGEAPEAATRRFDAASRAVLAEAAPLALPDGRWDKMVYPIRDCEQFLKAIC
jgi:hypothetical protein